VRIGRTELASGKVRLDMQWNELSAVLKFLNEPFEVVGEVFACARAGSFAWSISRNPNRAVLLTTGAL
jgi:hypothetical protein